jgi:hypothetical protein
MATRIVFLNGQETAVTGTEDEVVQVVRRCHPNQVKLEGIDAVVLNARASSGALGRRSAAITEGHAQATPPAGPGRLSR